MFAGRFLSGPVRLLGKLRSLALRVDFMRSDVFQRTMAAKTILRYWRAKVRRERAQRAWMLTAVLNKYSAKIMPALRARVRETCAGR